MIYNSLIMRGVPPFEILQQVTGAYFLSRSLRIIADFGVADALGDEPATASDLARAKGTHPGALGRILSLLSTRRIENKLERAFGTNGRSVIWPSNSRAQRPGTLVPHDVPQPFEVRW